MCLCVQVCMVTFVYMKGMQANASASIVLSQTHIDTEEFSILSIFLPPFQGVLLLLKVQAIQGGAYVFLSVCLGLQLQKLCNV